LELIESTIMASIDRGLDRICDREYLPAPGVKVEHLTPAPVTKDSVWRRHDERGPGAP
jgi:hypothetical protein